MTADDESSRAMWLGASRRARRGECADALAIECSTLSHDWVLELARRSRARLQLRGLAGHRPARCRAPRARSRCWLAPTRGPRCSRPVFASLATRVLHFGGVGQGTVYKLMVNLIGACRSPRRRKGWCWPKRPASICGWSVMHRSGQAASPQVVRNVRRFVAAIIRAR
jgi:3-hydroxyisobutyrate dehydrogenase